MSKKISILVPVLLLISCVTLDKSLPIVGNVG